MRSALLFLCLIAAPTRAVAEAASRDSLPPWSYQEMVQAVRTIPEAWNPSDVRKLELLAWYGKVDDRPLGVNVALFWLEFTQAGKRRWALVQMAQNPITPPRDDLRSRLARRRWRPYTIFDVDWQPIAGFDHPPTTDDVKRFLRFWDESEVGWKVLTSGVRLATWKRLFGEEPTFRVNRRRPRTGRHPGTFRALAKASTLQPITDAELEGLTGERRRLVQVVSRVSRDANFSDQVLNAYGHRCAVTRMQLRLIDAAHILPVAAPDSPDHVINGIALSPTYHRAYDGGLIYLNDEHVMALNPKRVHLLSSLNLSGGLDVFQAPLGKIHLPADRRQWPDARLIRRANQYRRIEEQ